MADIQYQCPKGSSIIPHSNTDSSLLWITMTPMEVEYATTYDTTGGSGLSIKETKTDFAVRLLAPSNILETVSHSWDIWESIASRMAGWGMKFEKMLEEGKGAFKTIERIYNNKDSIGWKNIAPEILSAVGHTKVPAQRLDAPLIYTASERREFTMDFQLVPVGMEAFEMMDIIQVLQGFSAPGKTGTISISLPHVWKVQAEIFTQSGDATPVFLPLYIEQAAITSIQPSYHGPYIDGNPQWITLTITFKELTPIFNSQFGVVPYTP